LLLDASACSGPTVHPAWPKDQLSSWYCAPVDAFNLNDNCVDVTLRAAAPGRLVQVQIEPDGLVWDLRNSCQTVRDGEHKPLLHLPPGEPGVAKISGRFMASKGEEHYQWAMASPALHFGEVFRELLRRRGIAVASPTVVRERVTEPGELFARHRSPLDRVVGPILKRSQNLFAECLLRAVGRAGGGDGSFSSGARAAADYLTQIGVKGEVVDGSGLARANQCSARTLVTVLRRMWFDPQREIVLSALPIAGVDGSLANRMKQAPAMGNVMAKTGYINSVSALAGYIRTQDGRWLAFAMLFNGFAGSLSNAEIKSAYQDRICQLLASGR
jgi:D-alanyl-D-alanine carboxypeptidase/D-alanyl-D-alanine-endopeptidase (penicillin-binding protein 4)